MKTITKFTCPALAALALACFAVLSTAQAVTPPPDGGYPNRTTAEGDNALFNLTTGVDNTAVGFDALWKNTTGSYNTAIGEQTLYLNVSGIYNTATGYRALYTNATGFKNTADGFRALFSNTTGSYNTANGFQALYFNTDGFGNTAVGHDALYYNTLGGANTATGDFALFSNTTGGGNTANGIHALYFNTDGSGNTADGDVSLFANTVGSTNTATGHGALNRNTTGNNNIALGSLAGQNLTTGDSNIDIGNAGVAAEANTIRIGTQGTQYATFIAGINGVAVTGAAVVVSSTGRLGVAPSSERFKDQIRPMDKVSEAILALKPVTFHYKKDIDPSSISQFGLVAEEVEKVNPDLVVRDEKGKPYSVRYDAVNAMLLNEFLKEHKTVQEQGATITELKKEIAALTAGLQKVSAQLEASKTVPHVVNNP